MAGEQFNPTPKDVAARQAEAYNEVARREMDKLADSRLAQALITTGIGILSIRDWPRRLTHRTPSDPEVNNSGVQETPEQFPKSRFGKALLNTGITILSVRDLPRRLIYGSTPSDREQNK